MLRIFALLTAALLTAGAASLLAGCKGNVTSAAYPERNAGPPPPVAAHRAASDPLHADPLTAPQWRHADWTPLTAPANTPHTPAPCRAALLFDPQNLYVAFISNDQSESVLRDAVSLFLDTTPAGDGREVVQVQVDADGHANCAWLRADVAAQPLPDGSPDFAQPRFTLPDINLPGLTAQVAHGADGATPVWTAVLAIPLAALPTPLRVVAEPGAHWKINLLRTVVTGRDGQRADQLQSNLSPVYVGAQPVSPYRMSPLHLEK